MQSYVYIGYSALNNQSKIGQTTQTPQRRACDIRKTADKDFQLLTYKQINELNNKGSFSLAIESFMRARLLRAGYTQIGNDHFHCTKEMLNSFVQIAQKAANDFCEIEQWGASVWSE